VEQTQFKVEWIDGRREPQCAPDSNYPNGKALDCSLGASRTCVAQLTYPAKRCGVYMVECQMCGIRIACTTAGRPDDPTSITIACLPMRDEV
jgi:hypothetical protein